MARILLVEDDISIISSLTEFLQAEGYRVKSVPGQTAALELLEKANRETAWCSDDLKRRRLLLLGQMRKSKRKFGVDSAAMGARPGWGVVIKSVLLALIAVAAGFAIVFISDALLLADYRLWCFATIRAFAPHHIPMILAFVPMWLVYYVSSSVSANCYNYVQMGEHKGTSVVWQMFFAFLGPQIMIMGQYIKFFTTGKMVLDPITGIMGIWLFPIVLILPLSVLINHVIYRKTKNPYIGGIITALIACILTVTNTLTG